MKLFGRGINKESINTFWQNLRTSSHKRTLGILAFALLILSVPLTITLLGQQQDVRQRASSNENAFNFYVSALNGGANEVFGRPVEIKATNQYGGVTGVYTSISSPAKLSLVAGPYTFKATAPSGYYSSPSSYSTSVYRDYQQATFRIYKNSSSNPTPTPQNSTFPTSSPSSPSTKATPTPIPTYSISGKVFFDKDVNSLYGSSDRLYLGQDRGQATVYLYGPVSKITTTSGGNYSFTGIPAGNYEVRLDLPDFYKATSGTCNTLGCRDKTSINTTVGPSKSSIDFGVIALYRISGKVYVGSTASGYNSATVKLYDTVTGKLYSTVHTDKNGNYDFGKIPAVQWKVELSTPSNYSGITSTSRTFILQKDRIDIDFGIAKK